MLQFTILAQEEPSWWTAVFLAALEAFWNWLVSAVETVMDTVLNLMLSAVPDDYMAQGAAFRHYVEAANCWVPLDYGLTMLGVFYTFLGVFVVFKFILKAIPTVG